MFNALLRPHLRELKPYSSARDEFSGTASVYLDANENPYGPASGPAYNRYPDPYQQELKKALCALKGVAPEQVFLGNGSDEPIDLLIRAFCEPGKDKIMLTPPTYGMYAVSAGINNVEMLSVPLLPNFQLNMPELLPALEDEKLKLVFLCSPNNPTGNLLREEDIRQILERFQGIVVIDEAYIDFADQPSWLRVLRQYDRLLVMQTFSKAWGIAALRLGMAFGHPELIRILNRIKPPYNINAYTQEYALSLLKNADRVKAQVAEIKQERQRMATALADMPAIEEVFPSEANFLLVRVKGARKLYEQLLTQGIVLRDRSRVILCDNCLRITIGQAQENDQLLEQMAAWFQAHIYTTSNT